MTGRSVDLKLLGHRATIIKNDDSFLSLICGLFFFIIILVLSFFLFFPVVFFLLSLVFGVTLSRTFFFLPNFSHFSIPSYSLFTTPYTSSMPFCFPSPPPVSVYFPSSSSLLPYFSFFFCVDPEGQSPKGEVCLQPKWPHSCPTLLVLILHSLFNLFLILNIVFFLTIALLCIKTSCLLVIPSGIGA